MDVSEDGNIYSVSGTVTIKMKFNKDSGTWECDGLQRNDDYKFIWKVTGTYASFDYDLMYGIIYYFEGYDQQEEKAKVYIACIKYSESGPYSNECSDLYNWYVDYEYEKDEKLNTILNTKGLTDYEIHFTNDEMICPKTDSELMKISDGKTSLAILSQKIGWNYNDNGFGLSGSDDVKIDTIANPNSIYAPYKDIISNLYPDSGTYSIVDIDNDGIYELIVGEGKTMDYYNQIYTIVNGSAIEIGDFDYKGDIYKTDKGIYTVYNDYDYESYLITKNGDNIDKKKLTEKQ